MSTSVLRRYTPPTCTLEIAATGSALSRWTDRTVLKNLRFQLSFDDPKLPEDQQVTIRGDRTQLEALCEAVDAYVQRLLGHSIEPISPLLSPVSDRGAEATEVAVAQPEVAVGEKAAEIGIHLQAKGLTAHELWLGTLANSDFGSVIRLSALQLFDLANALDAYHAEALTLPALGRPAWLQSPAGWARIAAMALLAIGATGAVTKFVMDISTPTPQVAANSRELEMNAAQGSPTPMSPLVPPMTATLPPSAAKVEPLLPPKPPAGALQPVPVPGQVAVAPPPAAIPVDQLPQPKTLEVPPSAGVAPTAPERLSTVPIQVGSDFAANPAGDSSSQPGNPAASAPLPDAATAVAIAPLSASQSRAAGGIAAQEMAPSGGSAASNENSVATNSTAANGTAFDTYPQIAEIRNYFLQNWQPPEGLTQTLQYQLVLNADGTLQRIIPIGSASERFVDRTNMPLMNEPFVSPLQNLNTLQVRLVLDPDGKVRTFPGDRIPGNPSSGNRTPGN